MRATQIDANRAAEHVRLPGRHLAPGGTSKGYGRGDEDKTPSFHARIPIDIGARLRAASTRANRHSLEPTHCGDEIEEALEVNGSTVVARGEATKVLHPIEASLDAVAMFVDEFVVGDDDLARAV